LTENLTQKLRIESVKASNASQASGGVPQCLVGL
jgi:hypothetical protein